MCFCFATKLFWRWLTSSFEQKKPLELTNVHINIFFTTCTKQGKGFKKRKKRKARRPYARIKTNLGRMSPWKLSERQLFLFSIPVWTQGREILVSFSHIHNRSQLKGNWASDLARMGTSPISSAIAEYLCWWRRATPVRYFNTKPCLVNCLNDAVSKQHLP